jgi:hypothetical protein
MTLDSHRYFKGLVTLLYEFELLAPYDFSQIVGLSCRWLNFLDFKTFHVSQKLFKGNELLLLNFAIGKDLRFALSLNVDVKYLVPYSSIACYTGR